jgi:outer membrane lipoprotein-sorting protein
MIKRVVLGFALALCMAVSCRAGISASSSVDDVLDALDQRGHDLKSLTADVSMGDVDPNIGDVGATHTGRLVYQDLGNGNARFRLLFDKKISGKAIQNQKHDYVYADGKLTDRDYERKQQSTKQILKPGEKMELFKLNGPFPLPLGQNKDDVHKTFDVTKVAPADDDPKGTIHLQLTPHANSDIARQFSAIDIWVDPATALPVRVKTMNANQTSLKITDLTNVKLNPPLKDSDFQMDKVNLDDGWNAKSE